MSNLAIGYENKIPMFLYDGFVDCILQVIRGGNEYKYGVFTLRSSVGCISSLASGPEFMKERIATKPVFESLLQVISDFCID